MYVWRMGFVLLGRSVGQSVLPNTKTCKSCNTLKQIVQHVKKVEIFRYLCYGYETRKDRHEIRTKKKSERRESLSVVKFTGVHTRVRVCVCV